jgi:hypothetical protein
MPTISQLPEANAVGEGDELPISQTGITRYVTVSELLATTQGAIELPSSNLLGRVSLGPGGPEAIPVGIGLGLLGGNLQANGTDHSGFPVAPSLNLTNQAVINAGGTPELLPLSDLQQGLFAAGQNVEISGSGTISASTDPSVTSELSTLTSGLATTEANLAALAARVPTGGYVTLNAQGQITQPTVGDVSLGTVAVSAGIAARSVLAMTLDTLNVLDFGASTHGVDSAPAFEAAFSALPNSGGEIFMPAGDYTIASSLVWAGKALTLRGAGKGVTRLHIQHTGIAFDISQTNPFNKVVLRDFSAFAENTSGQTAAVARLTYPSEPSFGYVSAYITDIECFGYPNSQNGAPPFPQTFLRGFVLMNCWSVQINNVSWFGPPSVAGATSSAVIELNRAFDTRITGVQAYYGNAVVLQTGYCEGIYFTNPLVVGVDYLFTQTDITQWQGYVPGKLVLLGLWAANGEVNTNLGTVNASNVAGGWFVGLDISRDGGPNDQQLLFSLTSCSSFYVVGCNFNGGPAGGNSQDIAFNFTSTFNSSNNTIGACQFANMATIIKINASNGTVGLTTFALNISNVPISTAVIDNSSSSVGNYLIFQSPANSVVPAGIANTKDHIFAASDGSTLYRINAVLGAANYLRHQAATHSNPPTIAFDGSDGTINGVIQTKGGALYINASGGTSGSGNLLSLMNVAGATSWPVFQNATSGNLNLLETNTGGLSVQPKGSLWLAPESGLFISGLPVTKPAAGSNEIWNNGGVLSIA